jgi:hypothetical protein
VSKYLDQVVTDRCTHYGVLVSAMLDTTNKVRQGMLGRARQRIAWELRREWKELGLSFQPSFAEISRALGYASHHGSIEAIRREDRNVELRATEVAL